MTINYPLSIPLEEFSDIRWEHENTVSAPRSSFTGKQQKQIFPRTLWRGDVTYPEIDQTRGKEIIGGFLAALYGQEGTFLLGDPLFRTPRGEAANNASSPLVDGAGQVGKSLAVRAAPANLSNWLRIGDHIQIGPDSRARLHMVVASNVNTDGSGEASIDIWPRLKEATLDGDPITYLSPRGLFQLDTNNPGWDESAPFRFGIGFPVVEV